MALDLELMREVRPLVAAQGFGPGAPPIGSLPNGALRTWSSPPAPGGRAWWDRRMKDPFGCDAPPLLASSGTADRAAARRTVASHAVDARELTLLLDMLGLLPETGSEPARQPGWNADLHG
ncbi:hypothetical protein AB0D54_32730 [Streptomyces xanthophaeus]|uniref:hypothetical protein n=1 Tax=Streptomyces xanthophaeus TaxID=67385 RepID=UPI0034493C75